MAYTPSRPINALVPGKDSAFIPEIAIDPAAIEQALSIGDLSKMPAHVRVAYYLSACQSMGLNPFTRPLIAMKTQSGEMHLYATAACAEQLRKRDRISMRVKNRLKEDGLYIVTVEASTPDGRVEESQGIVEITNLKGQALATALMRCETKAKRRATMAICGMGFPSDEDVTGQVVQMDYRNGVIKDAPVRTLDTPPPLSALTSEVYGGEGSAEDSLVARIDALLRAQGLDREKIAAYWARMDKKYAGRTPMTLTMIFEQLQAVADRKRAAAMQEYHNAVTGEDDGSDTPFLPDEWDKNEKASEASLETTAESESF